MVPGVFFLEGGLKLEALYVLLQQAPMSPSPDQLEVPQHDFLLGVVKKQEDQ